ncbi:MAG: sugar ABC transporter ATP-binding protein, partial [Synergistetes bacterium]|nr:sugar ABC transporter ATP-binding protein [Synergistota bacterium]
MNAILSVKGIHKRFPGVYALKGVSLNVFPGEVHALVGENGAGKSTLMNIIAGVFKPDEGKIFLDGEERVWSSTADALHAGISTIFQELSVMPNLSVAENIFLGMEPLKGPIVKFGGMYRASKKLLGDFGLDVKPDERLGNYTIAIQQMVEIIRAIKRKAKVIIMDEPTSSLTEKEVEKTFEVMRHLKSEGIAIIFISHKLEEVFEIADRISVLRDGELVGTAGVEELNEDIVAEMMVGRKIDSYYIKEVSEIGQEVLRVEGFSGDGFEGVDFSLNRGEILGFYGLVGAGRTELME